jgi:serine/threonine protein kinase
MPVSSLPIHHDRLPKLGDTFAEKYRLECILGSGGMGVVFGATHLITHKRVAIKWLAGGSDEGALSDTTQRFVREARLGGEFQHPNVVQVYDLGESDGSFYMVMEWLEGESLATRLERDHQLSFAQTCTYLIPCMHALQRAHDAGIIHRDIKPANIFLCAATSDRPELSKVLDFGISKRISAQVDTTSFVTRTGMLIGTPQYLAPEQLRARPVDRRTDIYGFGVLLYQTLAGVPPFDADNFGDLVVQISVGTPRSLRELQPDLPVGVEQIVARAMARDPDERFSTLYELISSLQALDPAPLSAATQPQLDVPVSVSLPLAAAASPKRRALIASAAVAVVLAAGAGAWWLQRDSGTRARHRTGKAGITRGNVDVSTTRNAARSGAANATLDTPSSGAAHSGVRSAAPGQIDPAGNGSNDNAAIDPARNGSSDNTAIDPARNGSSDNAAVDPALTPSSAAARQNAAKLALPPVDAAAPKRDNASIVEAASTLDKPTVKPVARVPARAPSTSAPEPPQPTAAPTPGPEHNPLHMNIQ